MGILERKHPSKHPDDGALGVVLASPMDITEPESPTAEADVISKTSEAVQIAVDPGLDRDYETAF